MVFEGCGRNPFADRPGETRRRGGGTGHHNGVTLCGTNSTRGQEPRFGTVNDDLAVEIGNEKNDLKISQPRSRRRQVGIRAEPEVPGFAGIAGPLRLVRQIKLRFDVLYQHFHAPRL